MKTDSLLADNNLKFIKLSGGLGNQLFQYFFACATFKASNDCVLFDISDYFNGIAKRDFVLEKLGLQGHYITLDKNSYRDQGVEYVDLTILRTFGSCNPAVGTTLRRIRLVSEKEIYFTPLSEYDLSENIYVEGYWQSYRYWDAQTCFPLDHSDLPTPPLSSSLACIAPTSQRLPQEICAIHFRRGDYQTEFNEQYHGKCELAYFFRAMQLSGAKQFHVYSDDIASARQAFSPFDNVSVIASQPHDEIEDFQSLARYSQLIISNSSFSFLAAYLARASHHAHVIAPYPWYSFKNVGPDLPEKWLRLNRATGTTPQEDAAQIYDAKISVIIPVHVRHQYIREAVTSVLDQTIKATEIVLCLNGASDRARVEANRLASLHNNIRIVEVPFPGLSRARNAGIRAAVGEYIAFLDDDDIWETTKLEAQITAAVHNAADLIATNYYTFTDLENKHFVSDLRSNRQNLWKYDLSVANYLSGGSAVLVRRDVFDSAGYFDETMPSCEDHDMWRRAAVAGYRIHFIDECLVGYRKDADNMTSKPQLMLQGELMHLAKILNEGEAYEPFAHRFYGRIQPLLKGYFDVPQSDANIVKALEAIDMLTDREPLIYSQARFYYARQLRQIFRERKFSETLRRKFLEPLKSKNINYSDFALHLGQTIMIIFVKLPAEVITYFFGYLNRFLNRNR